MASFSSSFSTSVSSFSCSCHCHSESPSPPPAFGASATISTPQSSPAGAAGLVPTKKRQLVAPSAVAVVEVPVTSVAAGGGLITPPKKTNSLNAPEAPKSSHAGAASLVKKNPKDDLRDALKRMNEAHPEENFNNVLYPMVYGIPYPGYSDEDFDENEPLDDEELSEEELEDIIERSREACRERKNKYTF